MFLFGTIKKRKSVYEVNRFFEVFVEVRVNAIIAKNLKAKMYVGVEQQSHAP